MRKIRLLILIICFLCIIFYGCNGKKDNDNLVNNQNTVQENEDKSEPPRNEREDIGPPQDEDYSWTEND